VHSSGGRGAEASSPAALAASGHPAALGDPASAGGLDSMTHRGPFQPRPFCDSVILSTEKPGTVGPGEPALTLCVRRGFLSGGPQALWSGGSWCMDPYAGPMLSVSSNLLAIRIFTAVLRFLGMMEMAQGCFSAERNMGGWVVIHLLEKFGNSSLKANVELSGEMSRAQGINLS